jgi:hypothetical protein
MNLNDLDEDEARALEMVAKAVRTEEPSQDIIDACSLPEDKLRWVFQNIGMLDRIVHAEAPGPQADAFVNVALYGLHPDLLSALPGLGDFVGERVEAIVDEVLDTLASRVLSYDDSLTSIPDDMGRTPRERRDWLEAAIQAVVDYRQYTLERCVNAAAARAARAGFEMGELTETGIPDGLSAFIRSQDAEAVSVDSALEQAVPDASFIERAVLPDGRIVRVDLRTLHLVGGDPGAHGEAVRELAACAAVHRSSAPLPRVGELLLRLQASEAQRALGIAVAEVVVADLALAVRRADQLPNFGVALRSADEALRRRISVAAAAVGVADVVEDALRSATLSEDDLERLRGALVAGDLPGDDELELIDAVEARRGLRGSAALEAAGGVLTWDRLDPMVAGDV